MITAVSGVIMVMDLGLVGVPNLIPFTCLCLEMGMALIVTMGLGLDLEALLVVGLEMGGLIVGVTARGLALNLKVF